MVLRVIKSNFVGNIHSFIILLKSERNAMDQIKIEKQNIPFICENNLLYSE